MVRLASCTGAVAVLLVGCAAMSVDKMHSLQAKLGCGISPMQTEAIIGERLQTLENDSRATHFYRSGMADLWLVFSDGGLRSSQVIRVKGLIGTEQEPVVNHCP